MDILGQNPSYRNQSIGFLDLLADHHMIISTMIELPKPIRIYNKITKRNAEQFFVDCMSVKDARIEWVRDLAVSC